MYMYIAYENHENPRIFNEVAGLWLAETVETLTCLNMNGFKIFLTFEYLGPISYSSLDFVNYSTNYLHKLYYVTPYQYRISEKTFWFLFWVDKNKSPNSWAHCRQTVPIFSSTVHRTVELMRSPVVRRPSSSSVRRKLLLVETLTSTNIDRMWPNFVFGIVSCICTSHMKITKIHAYLMRLLDSDWLRPLKHSHV